MKNYIKGILSSTGFILIWLLIQVIFVFIFEIISMASGNFNREIMYMLCEITTILVYYLIFKEREYTLKDRCSFKKISMKSLFKLILVVIGISILSVTLIEMLNSFFPSYEEAIQDLVSSSIIINFINFVIIAPVFEEILFRGIILYNLKKYINIYSAIIIQAVLFSIMHGNVLQGIYTMILGIILGLIRYWTGSLWATIISHMIFNFLGSMIIIEIYTNLIFVYMIIGLLLTIIPLYYIYRDFKNKNNKELNMLN